MRDEHAIFCEAGNGGFLPWRTDGSYPGKSRKYDGLKEREERMIRPHRFPAPAGEKGRRIFGQKPTEGMNKKHESIQCHLPDLADHFFAAGDHRNADRQFPDRFPGGCRLFPCLQAGESFHGFKNLL